MFRTRWKSWLFLTQIWWGSFRQAFCSPWEQVGESSQWSPSVRPSCLPSSRLPAQTPLTPPPNSQGRPGVLEAPRLHPTSIVSCLHGEGASWPMTGQSPRLLPPWHPCVLEEPPPGWAVRPQPGTRSAVILKPCQGVSTAFEGTHPCLPGRMPGGLFLLHLCGPLRPGRHPRGSRTTGKAPSPCWPSLGTVCPPFPPLLVLCAEGGRPQPPSLFLLPLLWACQECREIRGRGHRKCLHPSKDSSSCKWKELGEGRGRRKVVPPPRPALQTEGLFLPSFGPL